MIFHIVSTFKAIVLNYQDKTASAHQWVRAIRKLRRETDLKKTKYPEHPRPVKSWIELT